MKYITTLILTVSFFVKTYACVVKDTIVIGSPAPALVYEKWIKGTPLHEFKKGKIYVVGFTGINCIPCRAAIPTITALAEKYAGDVSFINVYFMDKIELVEKYIGMQGNKVGYNVAVDKDRTMFNSWMRASGNHGIPNMYIVDKNGIISWIGHPGDKYFDYIIGRIVSGSFDRATDSMVRKRNEDNKKIMAPIYKILWSSDDSARKSIPAALAILDSITMKNPEASDHLLLKFRLLFKADELQAYRFIEELLSNHFKKKGSDPSGVLPGICGDILVKMNTLKHPDWDLIALLAERAYQVSDQLSAAFCLDVQATATARKGDYPKAAALQAQAIDNLKYCMGDTSRYVKLFNEKLDQYQQMPGK